MVVSLVRDNGADQEDMVAAYREAALKAWGAYLPMITERANLLNDDWDKTQGSACVPHVPLTPAHYFERRALLDEVAYLEMYYPQWASTCAINSIGRIQDAWVKAYAEELAEDAMGSRLMVNGELVKVRVDWPQAFALAFIIVASFMLGVSAPHIFGGGPVACPAVQPAK